MKHTAALAAAVMALSTIPAPAMAMSADSAAEAARPAVFVPASFEVPTLVTTPSFRIVPLGPDLVKVDFDAYMSSIEHLQKTFTRSTSWPHAGVTDADARGSEAIYLGEELVGRGGELAKGAAHGERRPLELAVQPLDGGR